MIKAFVERLFSKPIVLVAVSALCLSLPWLSVLSPLVFVGFVPILVLWHRKTKHFLLWTGLCLLLWMALTTWWVNIATLAGLVGIPLFGLLYGLGPIAIWNRLQNGVSEPLRWILFITLYLSAEGIYTYAEFSFPWLTLGNAFARTPQLVQWYEWTGLFGGSLWVLTVNVLVFKFVTSGKCLKTSVFAVVFPIVCSLVLYFTYTPDGTVRNFTVIQPNLNPYTEKYGSLTVDQQVDMILGEAAKKPADFYVAPETAIDDYMWVELLDVNPYVGKIKKFVRENGGVMIVGATTVQKVSPSMSYDYAARRIGNIYYMGFNTALWVDTTEHVDHYHKGCLVVGAEKLPYPRFFRAVEKLTGLNLGGIFGNYGRSRKRDVFHDIGTAICYESVYSEFFTEYVKAGAEIMTVITNDGWWNDTPGHVQHMSYSRLRAVETRRSIARSANTGISCLINGRGDIVDSLGWNSKGIVSGKLYTDTRQTLYVKLGDWPVRISWYLLGISLLYMLALKFRKKSHLV